jgi:NarL family two-component system sensor histidine kinase LiaS
MKIRLHSVMVRLTLSYIAVAMLTSLLIVVVSYGLGYVEWLPAVSSDEEIFQPGLSFGDPMGAIQLDVFEVGAVPFTLIVAAVVGLLSIPSALLLVWLTGRPLARRLDRIAAASRAFAEGEHDVRVADAAPDEVGQVAQQFNNMADALQQQVHLLRSLAHENAALAQTAEATGGHAERLRLSRDLHDALAQQLFSLTYGLSSLSVLIRQDANVGAARAELLSTMSEKALLDLRAMLLQIRPHTLSEKGLVATVREIKGKWEELYAVPVNLVITLNEQIYSSVIQQTLCLILQEALLNTAKHANAQSVTIRLQAQPQGITLSVQDNGKGLDTHSLQAGYGLIHMRERAEAIGGVLTLHSSAETGTGITVYLPHGSSQFDAPTPDPEYNARP